MRLKDKRVWINLILLVGLVFIFNASPAAQETPRSVVIITEPKANVWIDDINYGTTNADGELTIRNFRGGPRMLRIRAHGFREVKQVLPPGRTEIKIELVKTTDEGEIAFQQAEQLLSLDRDKAIEAFRRAIKLRPAYAEGHLALARALLDNNEPEEALKAVQAARKLRPKYAEASAVEGRIYKAFGEEAKAVAAFKRAISEGGGFQPEAQTGLGLLYRERAERSMSEGDFEAEKQNYLLAAAELRKAVTELASAPDAIVVYQLLGDSYERAKMYKDAIRVYEEFLRVFPDSNEATAVQSFIVQINKRLKGEQ